MTRTRVPATLWRDRSRSPSTERESRDSDYDHDSDEFMSDNEFDVYYGESRQENYTKDTQDEMITADVNQDGPFGGANAPTIRHVPTGSLSAPYGDATGSMSGTYGNSTWVPASAGHGAMLPMQFKPFVDLTGDAVAATEVDMEGRGGVGHGFGMQAESQGSWGMEESSQEIGESSREEE